MVGAFEGRLSGNRDTWTPDMEKETIVSLPGHLSCDSFCFKGLRLYMVLEIPVVGYFFVHCSDPHPPHESFS